MKGKTRDSADKDRGNRSARPPFLRTGLADFPQPALQSVGSTLRLAGTDMGSFQGEKHTLCKAGIGPTLMV